MKLIKPPRLEFYTFIFSMPLIDVVLNLILFKERFWTDQRVWFISFPLIFLWRHILVHARGVCRFYRTEISRSKAESQPHLLEGYDPVRGDDPECAGNILRV